MSIDEAALATELLGRHGVTTAERLAAIGIERGAVDNLVRQGRMRRPGTGVVVSTSWPETLDHRMALACAITRGVVRFPTAGTAWELRRVTPIGASSRLDRRGTAYSHAPRYTTSSHSLPTSKPRGAA